MAESPYLLIGSFAHLLTTHLLEYVHNNPVRRGYIEEPSHWRYSSAQNYEGKEGLVHVDMVIFFIGKIKRPLLRGERGVCDFDCCNNLK